MIVMKKQKSAGLLLCSTIIAFCMLFLFTTVKADAAVTPATVTGLKQTKAYTSSVNFTWGLAAGTGLKYEISYSTDNVNWKVYSNYNTSNEGYIGGLSAAKKYYVRVRAYTSEYVSGTGTVKTYGGYSSALQVVTQPSASVKGVKQTAQTVNAIKLTWNAMPGVSGYKVIYGRADIWYSKKPGKKVVEVRKNTATLTKLSKNSDYTIQVIPVMKSNTFRAEGYPVTATATVLPSKVTGLKLDTWFDSLNSLYLECKKVNNADGYEYQIYDGSKRIITKNEKASGYYSSSIKNSRLKARKFFKARVRAYVIVNKKKYYSAWSASSYIAQQADVTAVKRKASGLQIKWEKISGASNYTVYVSTKRSSGYKKFITTRNTNTTITKYGSSKLKSGKNYYFYVVANKKAGKTIFKSSARYTWSQVYRK